MFQRKIRTRTFCRIVISITFFLSLLIFFGTKPNNEKVERTMKKKRDNFPLNYPQQLKKWLPAAVVPEQVGLPGEMGKAVQMSPKQEYLMKETFHLNEFNLVASDAVSFIRSLPDVRFEGCRDKSYPGRLPTTSIVIVFHNEAWSTLIRTVWSIVMRSPSELLAEIILVDDASDREHLGKILDDVVSRLPVPVRVIRIRKRSGLIRARLIGAKQVKGQVITFLDAHCECTEGWLEPLLARIAKNRKTVAIPIIDIISDDSFAYIPVSDLNWGGFDWKLNFIWSTEPRNGNGEDRTRPITTPTMAGGLFSIDKEYFEEIGTYDEGMEIWGGENLEMSFRVWQCGGKLEILPCSRVGHVFRKKAPYSFPGGGIEVVKRNSARVAEVWMDEWKHFFYEMNPSESNQVKIGDVSSRRNLRKMLNCKSFRWYLENVYPDSQMPMDYVFLGEIRNAETQECLDTMGRKDGGNIGIHSCHGLGGYQAFAYTKRRQIMSDGLCLEGDHSLVKLIDCKLMNYQAEILGQGWVAENGVIRHATSDLCLSKPESNDLTLPVLRKCNGSLGQQWITKSRLKR